MKWTHFFGFFPACLKFFFSPTLFQSQPIQKEKYPPETTFFFNGRRRIHPPPNRALKKGGAGGENFTFKSKKFRIYFFGRGRGKKGSIFLNKLIPGPPITKFSRFFFSISFLSVKLGVFPHFLGAKKKKKRGPSPHLPFWMVWGLLFCIFFFHNSEKNHYKFFNFFFKGPFQRTPIKPFLVISPCFPGFFFPGGHLGFV